MAGEVRGRSRQGPEIWLKVFKVCFGWPQKCIFFNEEMLEVPNLEEEIYRFREESLIIR